MAAPDGASPLKTCQRAAASLHGLCGLRLRAVSAWYRTAPVPAPLPPSKQPDYVNGVVALTGAVAPQALLAALQALEAASGRVRGEANAARTLDLDIIDIDGLIRAAPDPVLPHPRMHLRAFVLRPLLDVATAWTHPVLQQTASALLATLPLQDITPV